MTSQQLPCRLWLHPIHLLSTGEVPKPLRLKADSSRTAATFPSRGAIRAVSSRFASYTELQHQVTLQDDQEGHLIITGKKGASDKVKLYLSEMSFVQARGPIPKEIDKAPWHTLPVISFMPMEEEPNKVTSLSSDKDQKDHKHQRDQKDVKTQSDQKDACENKGDKDQKASADESGSTSKKIAEKDGQLANAKPSNNNSTGEVWVFVVEGNDEAMWSAIRTCSLYGAIRDDLHESYALREKAIGVGGCASVYLGDDARTRAKNEKSPKSPPIAVKVFNETGNKALETLKREVSLLMKVQPHPNIVAFHGMFIFDAGSLTEAPQYAILLEYCSGGDLYDKVHGSGPFKESKSAEIVGDILKALDHIHAKDMVHRDVKAENVLLSTQGRAVLSDFGIASMVSDSKAMQVRCGSPGYVAPEILAGVAYNVKVDIFGVGAILHFLMTCNLPFTGRDVATILQKNARCEIKMEMNPRLTRMSSNGKSILKELLMKDPALRPSAAQALQHSWLKSALEETGSQDRHAKPRASFRQDLVDADPSKDSNTSSSSSKQSTVCPSGSSSSSSPLYSADCCPPSPKTPVTPPAGEPVRRHRNKAKTAGPNITMQASRALEQIRELQKATKQEPSDQSPEPTDVPTPQPPAVPTPVRRTNKAMSVCAGKSGMDAATLSAQQSIKDALHTQEDLAGNNLQGDAARRGGSHTPLSSSNTPVQGSLTLRMRRMRQQQQLQQQQQQLLQQRKAQEAAGNGNRHIPLMFRQQQQQQQEQQQQQ